MWIAGITNVFYGIILYIFMDKNSKFRKVIGNTGEEFAVKYLLDNSFKIIKRNFIMWGGELDIVAGKNGRIHVIEVKTASEGSSIRPEENAHFKKMHKVAKIAEYYVVAVLKSNQPFHLHLITVILDKDQKQIDLKFFENIEI